MYFSAKIAVITLYSPEAFCENMYIACVTTALIYLNNTVIMRTVSVPTSIARSHGGVMISLEAQGWRQDQVGFG